MKYLLFSVLLFAGIAAYAGEEVDFSTPTYVNPTTFSFIKIKSLDFDWDNAIIKITVRNTATDGATDRTFVYTSTTATAMMIQLNKMNFTTTSLQKRIFQQLLNDGLIQNGTVTGSPD